MTTDEIKKLLANITQGEWEPCVFCEKGESGYNYGAWFGKGPSHFETKCHEQYGEEQKKKAAVDAEFIAAAPSIVRQLLEEIESMKNEIKTLRGE